MSAEYKKTCELLSPAGSLEKLETVYTYGADAAYIGVDEFSLRENGERIDLSSKDELNRIKQRHKGKKLYGAINMFFFENDLYNLDKKIDEIGALPFDAFIVSDLGAASVIRKHLPNMPLHLSTQSSCTNSESVKVYRDLGFSRIILAREVNLENIRKIHNDVKDVELEAFVHGAMCMAVSGRCILSAACTKRSANRGECAHTCRWRYRLALEEEERPGLYMPIEEHNNFTTILSSKDLCMIDYVDELVDAGLSSLKIEGRMKSTYYAAITTRAYRKALDGDKDIALYKNELEKVSHREWTTGFFFDDEKIAFAPPKEEYLRSYRFLGTVKENVRDNIWSIDIKNQISSLRDIEAIAPDVITLPLGKVTTLDEEFNEVEHIDHGKVGYIKTDAKIGSGFILRELI